jgi:hypothetical protein
MTSITNDLVDLLYLIRINFSKNLLAWGLFKSLSLWAPINSQSIWILIPLIQRERRPRIQSIYTSVTNITCQWRRSWTETKKWEFVLSSNSRCWTTKTVSPSRELKNSIWIKLVLSKLRKSYSKRRLSSSGFARKAVLLQKVSKSR